MYDVVSTILRRSFIAALMVGGFGVTSGCDGETDEMGAVELVAVADDGETFIAIVADDETVAVYTCDGTEEAVNTFEWLVGDNEGGSFDISSPDAAVVGTFADDGSASGTLTVNAVDYTFTATPASGDEGMYYTDDGDYYGGWVVIGDSVRGAVINRLQTGAIAVGVSFSPSVGTVDVDGVTLTPTKQTVLDYQ